MAKRADVLRSFRRSQSSAVLVPLGLLCALALVQGIAIRVLLSASAQAARSDHVLALAERNRKLLIDEETGLRGYHLTGDRSFLEPLERARGELPTVREELEALLREDPAQSATYATLQRLADEWEEYANARLGRADAAGRSDLLRDEVAGKHKMDEIRDAADQLIMAESPRTRARSANVQILGRWLLFGSVAWTAAVGLVLAYFSRGHLASLASRHEAALADARREAASASSAAREVRALNEQLERRVAERTAALKAANAELEAFSYSVSHDLRAPLRHVAGFIQMLNRTAAPKLDEKERRYLDTIAGAAQQAGRLIDDLLSFSRMTRAELQWTRVDTAALAREVRDELSRELVSREVRWRFGSLPEVRGDREMLRQVFQNLFSNAVKYTRDRSPAEIEVGSVRDEDGRIVFFVQDNGVGFDMQYAHKLFGVFQRLHRSDEFEGTGIGLANVRRIVLRHGGEVSARAELGRGARFSFSLPSHVGRDASEDETVESPSPAPEAHA